MVSQSYSQGFNLSSKRVHNLDSPQRNGCPDKQRLYLDGAILFDEPKGRK